MTSTIKSNNHNSPYTVSRPLSRVELHVHLDGGIRHETIYELTKAKGLPLPGDGSLEALTKYLVITNGVSLEDFLKGFDIILDSLIGDLDSIERIAYEFVEDSRNQGIAYSEARFSPHLLIPRDILAESGECKSLVWEVTRALMKGLERGQVDFGTKTNLIVNCIRGRPDFWFDHSLELASDVNFHQGRIIGVDIAGYADTASEHTMTHDKAVEFCLDAVKLGIPRTIHAGESGEGKMVTFAVDQLQAMRIGHGYRLSTDSEAYSRICAEQIHLETCPWSSLLTGSVPTTQQPHPIVQFFEDGFNVSVNTDDPTLTGSKLDDEYNLLRSWGLQDHHFVKANFNAARSCFLPENQKADLIQELSKTYGFIA